MGPQYFTFPTSSPNFTTERLLFQYSTDTAVQGDRSDTAGYNPEYVNVSIGTTFSAADSTSGRQPGIVSG